MNTIFLDSVAAFINPALSIGLTEKISITLTYNKFIIKKKKLLLYLKLLNFQPFLRIRVK